MKAQAFADNMIREGYVKTDEFGDIVLVSEEERHQFQTIHPSPKKFEWFCLSLLKVLRAQILSLWTMSIFSEKLQVLSVLKSYNQLKKSLEKQRNSNAQQVGIQELNAHNAGICQRLAKYDLTSLSQVLSHNFTRSLFLVPLDAIFA